MINRYKKGTSLTESVIAIGLIAIVVPSLIVLGVLSLKSGNNAARRAEASKIASAAIEAIKYIRDDPSSSCGYDALPVPNPTSYLEMNYSGSICGVMNDITPSANHEVTVSTAAENVYTRTIALSKYGASSIKVIVTVTWSDKTQDANSITESAIITDI